MAQRTGFDEHRIRIDVVEIARMISKRGHVSGTQGNVSARLGASDRFVITPSNTPYDQLKPEDLALCSIRCEHLAGELPPSIELPMHAAVYCARPEARAVIHTHSPSATAIATTGRVLPLRSIQAQEATGSEIISVAAYAPPGSSILADNVVAALGSRAKAVLLACHGMLAVGSSTGEAFAICELVEEASERFLRSKAID